METEGKIYKRYKKHKQHRRNRATAVVFEQGRVLLVRDRGKYHYSLPGGGIHKKEPTIEAVKRELYEELHLFSSTVTRLRECDFRGIVNKHKVCLVEVIGEPHISGHELESYMWWNMKDDIPVYRYVKKVVIKAKREA
jgi:hypothetical protein